MRIFPNKRNIFKLTNMWGSQIRAINIGRFIFSVAVGLVRVIGAPHGRQPFIYFITLILSHNMR